MIYYFVVVAVAVMLDCMDNGLRGNWWFVVTPCRTAWSPGVLGRAEARLRGLGHGPGFKMG